MAIVFVLPVRVKDDNEVRLESFAQRPDRCDFGDMGVLKSRRNELHDMT